MKRSNAVTSVRVGKMCLVFWTLDLPGHQEALRCVNVDGGVAAELELGLRGVLAGHPNGQFCD